jgi:hypothetical protein
VNWGVIFSPFIHFHFLGGEYTNWMKKRKKMDKKKYTSEELKKLGIFLEKKQNDENARDEENKKRKSYKLIRK